MLKTSPRCTLDRKYRSSAPGVVPSLKSNRSATWEVLENIYADAVLLSDDGPNGWSIRYSQGDFNPTSDSRLFPPRPQWEAKGYLPDEYSRWLLGDWRPIEELWEEIGVDPLRFEPADIELEEWLYDTSAGFERRDAEARFVHGHLLKPGECCPHGLAPALCPAALRRTTDSAREDCPGRDPLAGRGCVGTGG